MNTLLRHKWIKIVAAALSLSLIAAALALVEPSMSGPLRDGAETVSRPFLRLWARGTEQAKLWETVLRDGEALNRENQSLRRENGTLRRRLHAARLAERENARLRRLLGTEAENRAVTLLPAWILPRGGDSLTAEVTLDRGTADGVSAGLCVTDSAGNLLGLVKSAGTDCCAVTLLWDSGFRLAGQGADSETAGNLEGDLSLLADKRLRLTGLTEDEMVEIGETVVTLGWPGSVPGGLTVGTVTGIREDPGGLTRWAVIAPAAEQAAGEVFLAVPRRGGAE